MDDNENYLEYSKMNFSPFTTQFAGAIQTNTVNQFSAAKFAQNITTANGQVVGLVSGGDGGVQFLRQIDGNGNTFQSQSQTNQAQTTTQTTNMQQQTYITLPITMPGSKPGDAQQTVQIQVLNPNQIQPQQPKFQMGQMQIPIQSFQPGTTVLTVAYSPQDGEILQNHGLPEGMTILAAIQPQDLQLLAQAQTAAAIQQQQQQQQHQQQQQQQQLQQQTDYENEIDDGGKNNTIWTTNGSGGTTITADLSDILSRQNSQPNINLHQFLKFNNVADQPIIKREPEDSITDATTEDNSQTDNNDQSLDATTDEVEIDVNGKLKKKRKYKKKPPKPKRPKPGQVHITTALDGTVLYCCPECQMAYPEKESLEQHLGVHKIERRFICDICGAGLKRKEHLERHKLGHNPERPYICSVCMKGFKRKEHLNLHFVIHSGQKTEICGECGKGFYRKDHLRKHVKSHLAKRLKEELNAQNANNSASTSKQTSEIITQDVTSSVITTSPSTPTTTASTLCLPTQEVTIHVPTSNNQTMPVQMQIQLPQLVAQATSTDGSANDQLQ